MLRKVLCILGMLAALWTATATAQTSDPGRFDGKWGVTLVCPKAPDGALAFTYVFTADIKDAMLHGENGLAGHSGWMSLDGRIPSDGATTLEAQGLTSHSDYNLNYAKTGVPYHYPVTAHFDGDYGTGKWVTSRICNFTFRKL